MNLEGIVFDYAEEVGRITEAIVTAERVAISYEHGHQKWHVSAEKKEEEIYRGELSTNGRTPECSVELAVYKSKTGALIAFGTWTSRENGNSHHIVFQLYKTGESRKSSGELSKPVTKRNR